MRRLFLSWIALSVAIVSFHSPQRSSARKPDKLRHSERAIPNQYIVVLDNAASDTTDKDAVESAERLNRKYPGNLGKVYSNAIKGYSVEMSAETAEILSQDPGVKYVEEDAEIDPQTTQTGATWGISRIDEHNYTYPLDQNYDYSATGSGVSVYVIDTGVLTTHPDFGGRAVEAFDAYKENTPMTECNGHGTHVAGTIGSTTYGVAKNVMLYSVKVFPCSGSGTMSDVIAGVDWVTRRATTPAVANMSLTGVYSSSLDDAVRSSVASGVTYVVAAGNYGADACGYSPAHLPEVITVGSTDQRDFRDGISNYGSCVDVFAPGVLITSTWNQIGLPYTAISGTSTASPHVAGVAALYLEANPNAKPSEVQAAITSSATPDVVYNEGLGSPNLFLYSDLSASVGGGTCSGTSFTGLLAGSGSVDYKSSSGGFSGSTGQYSANLQMPDGAQFNLTLQKKAKSRWSTVATSSATPTGQSINYNGRSGTYRWTVTSVSGSGDYSLCTANP